MAAKAIGLGEGDSVSEAILGSNTRKLSFRNVGNGMYRVRYDQECDPGWHGFSLLVPLRAIRFVAGVSDVGFDSDPVNAEKCYGNPLREALIKLGSSSYGAIGKVEETESNESRAGMMAKFIEAIASATEMEGQSVAFFWISPGKGNLYVQSKNKVSAYLGGFPKCVLLEDEYNGIGYSIHSPEVVFVDWEKLNAQDKDGNWKNTLMKESATINLPEIMEHTREEGTKIIFIIDESHGAYSEIG